MRACIYTRVSTNDGSQTTENQKEPLRKFAESLGYEIVVEYEDLVSGGSSNRPDFQRMLKDGASGKFNIILVWSLDRFSREGISNTLHYLEVLKRHNVALKSLKESWVDTSDEGIAQLLLAIFSWVAAQERKRIGERVKEGLSRAKANGKHCGRPQGSKDKKYRKRSGYLLRWTKNRIKNNPSLVS